MSSSSKKRAELLGKPFGTASAILRKSLLYELAKKLSMLSCYRCGSDIKGVDEFSIEHKTAWMSSEDPVATFYDVDNIAFSHRSCNSAAAARPNRVYKDKKERSRAAFKRYYANDASRDKFLEKKRTRYRNSVADQI